MIKSIFKDLLGNIEKLRQKANTIKMPENADNKIYAESSEILGISSEEIKEFMEEKPQQNNEDLVKLVEKINNIVENKEQSNDYEEALGKFKELMVEKSNLELAVIRTEPGKKSTSQKDLCT